MELIESEANPEPTVTELTFDELGQIAGGTGSIPFIRISMNEVFISS